MYFYFQQGTAKTISITVCSSPGARDGGALAASRLSDYMENTRGTRGNDTRGTCRMKTIKCEIVSYSKVIH